MEGGSTIIGSEAASSRSSLMDLLLDLALHIIEGGWVMGMELGLVWMCFDFLDVQLAEGGGLGNGGGPGAVRDAGAMAGFAVLGRWFHHRKVGRN
eukprot:scaffold421297_cov95-Attheya_sp.AAC.1